MTDRIYKTVEITGSSTQGVDDAVRNGVGKAAESLRHLDWLEVTGIRGQIADGKVEHLQVTMKVGFRLE